MTAVGERLRADVPGTFRDAFIAESDTVHWRSWELAADAVRTGRPQPKEVFGTPAFDYYAKYPAEGEQFGKAMQNVSRFAAGAVLEAYDFSGVKTIMDVGGGNGSLALAILEKHPEMKGQVSTCRTSSRRRSSASTPPARPTAAVSSPASFFKAVPRGADLHALKFILHDWTDDECVEILKCCREAIEPSGRVLVVEMLVPEEIRPDFVMLMDLNMLVMTGGRERTVQEFEAVFTRAGFRMTRVIPTSSPFSLLEAKPA